MEKAKETTVQFSDRIKAIVSEKLQLQQRLTNEINELILATLEAKGVEYKDTNVSINKDLEIVIIG
jgi:GTP cyclohydrolase I